MTCKLEIDINAKICFNPIINSELCERYKKLDTDTVNVYKFNFMGVAKYINFHHLLNGGEIKLILEDHETINTLVKDNNVFLSFIDNRHFIYDLAYGTVNKYLSLKQSQETLNFARINDKQFVFINCDIGDVEISYYQIYDKVTNLPLFETPNKYNNSKL